MKALFFPWSEAVRNIWKEHGVIFSEPFVVFLDSNFERNFSTSTGLKPNARVCISTVKQRNHTPLYQKAETSKLNIVLKIMPDASFNLTFCWRSKSGVIVGTDCEQINEDDMETWIEGLQPEAYWKEISKKPVDHPFKNIKLPFTLTVYGFSTHMSINLHFNEATDVLRLEKEIAAFILAYNDKSEAADREFGVLHNFSFDKEVELNLFKIKIDTGSAGIYFLKKFLIFLKKKEHLQEVVFDY
ncbi:MAG: hypothetical protein RL115_2242 [Bacteroidota bacterium]|jgi:hypothetical protein